MPPRKSGSVVVVMQAEILHQEARCLHRQGLLAEAKAAYLQVLAMEPQRVSTLNNLAVLAMSEGDLAQARAWLTQAWAPLPLSLEADASRGEDWALVLNSCCQLALQEACFADAWRQGRKLVCLQPSARSLTNLAVSLAMHGRAAAAVRAQERALGLEMGSGPAWIARCKELLWQEDADAERSALRHRQLLNLATFALQADPESGWAWWLLRASLAASSTAWQSHPKPWEGLWAGRPCTHLQLWDEQGYGDTLQQLRWLTVVAERCTNVTILLRPQLLRLVQERLVLPGHCRVRALTNASQAWSSGVPHLPITALAGLLGEERLAVDGGPYLLRAAQRAQPDRVTIGVAWAAGTKNDPEARRAAELRSVPPETFFPWLGRLGEGWQRNGQPLSITWVNLQVGPANTTARPWLERLSLDGPGDTADWESTATWLDRMDAVISVDTGVAHLAGAMGLPTLVLLNRPCDWRWGQEGEQSPWYASWRMARCATTNAWSTGLASGERMLHAMLAATAPITP